MLVRREALDAAGGIAVDPRRAHRRLRAGRRLKAQGPIRLALDRAGRSLAPLSGARARSGRMVARSAYAQLRYLAAAAGSARVLGMALIYLAPPLLALFADGAARMLGLAAWLAMALSFQPMLRFYRLSPLWGLALPAIAALYLRLHPRFRLAASGAGRGGMWKGRAQAPGSGAA